MNAITLIWRQVLKELKLFQMKENKEDAGIAKAAEKAKKAFAGTEIKGKKLGVIGLGAIGVHSCKNRMIFVTTY